MTTAGNGADRPTPDGDTQAWWDALVDGILMINACRACGRPSLYVRPFCPHCWSTDVALQPASGNGRLYSWSVVHRNGPPFAERTPYVAAIVDLDEGPRLMTTISDCDHDDLRDGLPVRVAFDDRGDGLTVPVFVPAAE